MKSKIRLFLSLALLSVIIALLPSLTPAAQDSPPDVCQSGENLLPNCNFDGGTGGWTPFFEDGKAEFLVLQGGGECHAPLCPAGYIVTQSHFVGGIYRQVSVTKGNTYFANIVWLAFDSVANDKSVNAVAGGIGRRMGIDPFGGVDPRSPNVVWGPENWRNDCKICANQEVTAQAQADTITVFLRIDDRWRLHAAEKGYNVPASKDQFWLDDIGLKQVDGSAAPPPNPTSPPPTDTPAPPPTDTPVAKSSSSPATEEPQEEAIASLSSASLSANPDSEPSEVEEPQKEAIASLADASAEPALETEQISPVATPTQASAIAPPPTLTPSATPPPTATLEKRERPRSTSPRTHQLASKSELTLLPAGILNVAGTTVCFGGIFMGLMGAVIAGLVWLYRLGWGKVDENDPAEAEEIVVEIADDDRIDLSGF